jgi:hypothetical protein
MTARTREQREQIHDNKFESIARPELSRTEKDARAMAM